MELFEKKVARSSNDKKWKNQSLCTQIEELKSVTRFHDFGKN